MLYFVAGLAVEKKEITIEDALTIAKDEHAVLKHAPEAFVGDTKEAVKQKALIRWAVPEGEIDSLELVVLPFVS